MRFVCKVGVIILLASFLLMSHNASAVSTVLDMHEYDVINQEGQMRINCEFYTSAQNVSNVTDCSAHPAGTGNNPNLQFVRKITSTEQWAVKEGDIVEFDVNVWGNVDLTVGQSASGVYAFNLYFLGGSADFSSMEYKQTVVNNFTITGTSYSIYQAVYHVTYRARRDAAVYIGLTSSQRWFQWSGGTSSTLNFALYNVMQYRYRGSDVNKEQAEATQNAADDSEDAAQDNSSSAQTSNLIGVLSQFSTALTALQPTNCNVTLAWPSALGGNMQVNLCQNKNYAGNIISVFGSLTLIVFYIPFSLKILSMIYNEIRSFTNG